MASIPINLCNVCFEQVARYFMDCKCLYCENCFSARTKNGQLANNTAGQICSTCNKKTQHKSLDIRNEEQKKLFLQFYTPLDKNLEKIAKNMAFKQEQELRYVRHLQQTIEKLTRDNEQLKRSLSETQQKVLSTASYSCSTAVTATPITRQNMRNSENLAQPADNTPIDQNLNNKRNNWNQYLDNIQDYRYQQTGVANNSPEKRANVTTPQDRMCFTVNPIGKTPLNKNGSNYLAAQKNSVQQFRTSLQTLNLSTANQNSTASGNHLKSCHNDSVRDSGIRDHSYYGNEKKIKKF